ncbi:tetratricopeptide repeat protein [filamentous cyanobacterium LEGE 11480]|uniref:Tetratricopeptide repeat protein n=1 Tax=Romeriopsis navalis LEGE 11480 TaxID=2777977 RepID=A0A928Z768_9CYAN|nr:tetratricopeptide repeat protein [Romeriopsis navalis]MBE9032915.1 tetratricopeptide repeat protein [Romeriopsis navalis LEGE 11480]
MYNDNNLSKSRADHLVTKLHNQYSSSIITRGNQLARKITEESTPHETEEHAEKYNPLIASNLYINAISYVNRGEFREAIQDLNQALQICPNWPEAYHTRGNAKFQLGQLTDAIHDFNQALSINPNLAPTYLNRAMCYLGNNDIPNAIEDFSKVINIQPNHFEALYNRGTLYLQQGIFYLAIADLDSASKSNHKSNLAFCNLGVAYDGVGNIKSAVENYTKALEIDPSDAAVYIARAKALIKLNKRDQALEDYNHSIALDPQNGHSLILRGCCNSCAGHFIQAEEDFKAGIELLQHTSSLLTIVSALSESVEESALHPLYDLLKQTGDLHFAESKFKDAVEDYQFIVSLEPQNIPVQTRLENAKIMLLKAQENAYPTQGRAFLFKDIKDNLGMEKHFFLDFVSLGAQISRSIKKVEKFAPEIALELFRALQYALQDGAS